MSVLELIGRRIELKQITSWIEENGSQHVICIEAGGGIGKTRLLQEIVSRYKDSGNIKVLDIFDFDEDNCLSQKYLGHAIAKKLGEKIFRPYLTSQQSYRQMMIAGVDFNKRHQFRLEIRKKFNECFNQFSTTKRVLLPFDTSDKLEVGKGMWREFKNIGQLRNVCILIAGRNAHAVGDWLKQNGIFSVKKITLPRLNDEESELYLIRKQENISITRLEKELVDKIVRFSDGKPILLDLAVELICQDSFLEWIKQLHIDETSSEDCIKKFEIGLMQQIKKLLYPVDHLVQIMAYIYPLDEEIIKHFICKDAHGLLEKFKGYVFIKHLPGGYISLHDQVRTMIREYLYPLSLESNLYEIKEYSKEAALYCRDKAERLKIRCKEITEYNKKVEIDRQRHNLMERQVNYAFFFDIEEGIKNYSDVIWKLRRDCKFSVALRVQKSIKDYTNRFNDSQKREYKILNARLVNDFGKSKEAKRILEELKQDSCVNCQEEADIFNALASVNLRLGNIEKAINYQKQSIGILEKINNEHLPDLYNYSGYLRERQGYLKEAISDYDKALDCCIKNKKVHQGLQAKILDNLSHAYCQSGLHVEAQNYLDQAKRILSCLKNESSIARGEITQAVIYRDQGRYEESLNFLNEAINRLHEPDDHQKLIKAFFHRGWTCWFNAVDIDTNNKDGKVAYEDKLKKSRQYFEHSLELAERYHLKVEMPGILHQMSHVHHLLKEREEAVSKNNRAYDLSREVHDIRYAIDSLVGKAEFDYENGKIDKLSEYAAILKEEYEEKYPDFQRFYGRMKRIIAEAALDRKDYDTALENYIVGISQIRTHTGYGIYTLDKELKRLEKKMGNLSDDKFREWCTMMLEKWRPDAHNENYVHDDKYTLLQCWCIQQLSSR